MTTTRLAPDKNSTSDVSPEGVEVLVPPARANEPLSQRPPEGPFPISAMSRAIT
jgi:hypothetical protein